MDIETVRFYYRAGKVHLTYHVQERFNERGISISDVENVIEYGEIIEEDNDAMPLPKVLILGCNIVGRNMHVVVSVGNMGINIVTAYFPDKRWKQSGSRRKGMR